MARTPRFSLAVVWAVCTCLGAVIFLLPTIGVATAKIKTYPVALFLWP